MKRLKMMLLSLALFAVVGGALAFKARYQKQYCTAPVQQGGTCGVACPDITNSTTDGASQFFCTTLPVAGACEVNHVPLDCNTSTSLIGD